ncbi:MAG TPA: IclR family transcriptional regulator [Pseudonocardia sp.]|nr:IclR family transcriptional regulator [Pseudonocardia sp.]
MSGGRSADRRSGAARIFALLEVFEADPGPLSLSELGRRAGLPVSTTHRLVGELHGWGALERADDGRYLLGQRVWRLGAATSWERRLRRTCAGFTHLLAAEVGHAVAVSMLAGDRLICLDTVAGRHPSIRLARAGDEIPLFATSAGKLLLSATPRRRVAGLLAGGIPRLTERSMTSASVFAGQLEFARRNGYAVAFGESAAGQSSVSVSIGHPDVGPMALTILTPISHPDLTPLVQPLRRAALTIRGALAGPAFH